MTKHPDIVGYVLDLLEPAEQESIEAQLERDPALRAEVEVLQRSLALLASDDMIEPPAGLAHRTMRCFAQPHMMASREPVATRVPLRAVDLLVATGCLTLALLLVLPALYALRLDEDRVLCAQRLSRLGVALALYAQRESGQLPYIAAEGPLNNAGSFAVMLKSRDLLEDTNSLICPSANSMVAVVPDVDYVAQQREIKGPQWDRLRRLMSGSYGYVLGHQERGQHLGVPLRSDRQPIVSDRPCRASEAQANDNHNSPNHHGRGQNVLFADGSVRWLSSPQQAGDDLFTNNGGRVAAGWNAYDAVIGVSEAVPYPSADL